MGIPGRPLVRTHFGCPTAAALLLLSAAGCGVSDPAAAPGATARQEPASAPTSPARTGHDGLVADALSPCAGVSLDARRTYHPKSWTDGDVTFVGGSLTFVVPSEIPVTAGASARGRATLSFSLLGGGETTCVYRGTGYRAFGGKRYVLKRCRQASEPRDDEEDEDRLREGSEPLAFRVTTMTADRFHLRVEKGDNHFPATVVHLALPGPQVGDDDACTADRCDPVTGAVTHTPLALDDGDECTTDSCDVATGPAHVPVDGLYPVRQAAPPPGP